MSTGYRRIDRMQAFRASLASMKAARQRSRPVTLVEAVREQTVARTNIYYQEQRNGLTPYNEARREHAWLLRAEALSHAEIGARMATSGDQARRNIRRFNEDTVRRATAHTRFRWGRPENRAP